MVLGALLLIAEIIEGQTAELDPYPFFENFIPLTLALSVVGLGVAWKMEAAGGGMAVGFALANLFLYIATERTRIGAVALILLPIAFPGVLFLVCWWGSRKKTSS